MTEIPEHLRKRTEEARARAAREAREVGQNAVSTDPPQHHSQPPLDSSPEVTLAKSAPWWRKLASHWREYATGFVLMWAPWLVLGLLVVGSLPFHTSRSFTVKRWVARCFYWGNAQFWLMLLLPLAALLVLSLVAYVSDRRQQRERIRWGHSPSGEADAPKLSGKMIILLAAAVLGVLFGFATSWWNNKDVPRFYNQATIFKVVDLKNPPQNLKPLVNGARTGGSTGCDLVGNHDVPSCIQQGTLPVGGFEQRSMSYGGAMAYMSQSSGSGNNSKLLAETGVYLEPTVSGGKGSWTAVRDGSGIGSPIEGVAKWDGTPGALPELCRFDGNYRLSKALRGERSNSLGNLVREHYSPYFYRIQDVYGNCIERGEGPAEPVLYIPLIVEKRTGHRTVEVPAGLLEVHGSSSGKARFVFHESVSPSDGIPGPVYPLSIVQIQRQEHSWAAGRQYQSRGHFGFEPTTAKEQNANPTDFLLRAKWDGHEYWVSQMTPRGSDSQRITGYFLIPADTVQGGRLNTLTIYALNDGDPGAVNLELLINQVKQSVSNSKPGFFTAGGVLTEFTPVEDGKWVGYGLYDSLPAFKVTVDPKNIHPVFEDYVVTAGPGQVGGLEVCQKPLAELSKEDLARCAKGFIDALGK